MPVIVCKPGRPKAVAGRRYLCDFVSRKHPYSGVYPYWFLTPESAGNLLYQTPDWVRANYINEDASAIQ